MTRTTPVRTRSVPAIDLQSIKVTLEYIHGDIKDVGALRNVAIALKAALDELERSGHTALDPRFERLVSMPEGRLLR